MEVQFGALILMASRKDWKRPKIVLQGLRLEIMFLSMTDILGQLKWESLKKRRKDSRIILLNKCLNGKARIRTDGLIPKHRHYRNQHSMAFQIASASKEAYKSSFY